MNPSEGIKSPSRGPLAPGRALQAMTLAVAALVSTACGDKDDSEQPTTEMSCPQAAGTVAQCDALMEVCEKAPCEEDFCPAETACDSETLQLDECAAAEAALVGCPTPEVPAPTVSQEEPEDNDDDEAPEPTPPRTCDTEVDPDGSNPIFPDAPEPDEFTYSAENQNGATVETGAIDARCFTDGLEVRVEAKMLVKDGNDTFLAETVVASETIFEQRDSLVFVFSWPAYVDGFEVVGPEAIRMALEENGPHGALSNGNWRTEGI